MNKFWFSFFLLFPVVSHAATCEAYYPDQQGARIEFNGGYHMLSAAGDSTVYIWHNSRDNKQAVYKSSLPPGLLDFLQRAERGQLPCQH